MRSNKGLELTIAATALLQHARVLLRDVKQMESELLDHAEGVRGQIRLHASLSTIVQYIANDIRDFLALHPGLRIDLQESLSPAVVRAVAENTADIGVFGGTTVTAGLQVFPYHSDRLVVIMPPDHPLSHADKVKFREMAQYPLVGPQAGSYLNSLVLRAAADLDHPLKLSIRVNGFEPVRSMVEARLGIGLVPEHHARRYVSWGPSSPCSSTRSGPNDTGRSACARPKRSPHRSNCSSSTCLHVAIRNEPVSTPLAASSRSPGAPCPTA